MQCTPCACACTRARVLNIKHVTLLAHTFKDVLVYLFVRVCVYERA